MTDSLQTRFREGLALFDSGRVEDAIKIFESCLRSDGNNPHLVLNLGHAYSARGNTERAVVLYRELVDSNDLGMVYAACWSLADLKGYRFDQAETNRMKTLASQSAAHPQRFLLMFALGRALEQKNDYEAAFKALLEGNEQVAKERPFPGEPWRQLASALQSISHIPGPAHAPPGPAPLFIVGMPRSGSTLVEQILGAHSCVEATSELPFIENIARSLDRQGGYTSLLPRLSAEHCRQGAVTYLDQARPLLTGQCDFFTDKWPNNFWYIGLIRALFPGARIINVVRNPLDNAMGVYKQYFGHANEHSFRLEWVADYWEIYLSVMGHWGTLFPGEILHFSYAGMVANPEAAIRNLLDYCNLEFEEQLLCFHETERTVMTPSGQQVRQPIYKTAVGSAEPYRPYMGKAAARFDQIAARADSLFDL